MTDTLAQQPQASATSAPETMAWDSRARRMMMIYLPLSCFVLILLFPFYWMAITAFKPNAELYDYKTYNPFWIGSPTLVVCLDSGCANYDQLWMTTSLRGVAAGTLTVEILDEGVHSGDASGVVPSSFRILRQLLSRLEDEATGEIRPSSLYAQIPPERVEQAKRAAAALGNEVYAKFPFVPGAGPTIGLPGTRCAHTIASGHSTIVMIPIQPQMLIASACGCPRDLAIDPGRLPSL